MLELLEILEIFEILTLYAPKAAQSFPRGFQELQRLPRASPEAQGAAKAPQSSPALPQRLPRAPQSFPRSSKERPRAPQSFPSGPRSSRISRWLS